MSKRTSEMKGIKQLISSALFAFTGESKKVVHDNDHSTTNKEKYRTTTRHQSDDQSIAPIGQTAITNEDNDNHVVTLDLRKNKHVYQQEGTPETSKVWVKNGALQFGKLEQGYPVIAPTQGIAMFVNGVQIIQPTVVKPTDDIDFDLVETTVPSKWKIEISKDKTKAYVNVTPGIVRKRQLKDHKPTTRLQLQWHEQTSVQQSLTVKDIYDKLSEMGIVEGIQHPEIQAAVATQHPERFTIAKATQPQDGTDGYVKFLKNFKQINRPQQQKDGSVDYKEIQAFPKISTGEVLAEVYQPTEGIPGKTIFGQLIPAKQGKPVQLRLGHGVQLVDDEKIISMENGSPKVDARGRFVRIDIRPVLVLRDDVTVQTGNIRFNGNIEVQGSVEDTMVVEGNGSIMIHGHVSYGKILTSESVTTGKNVLSSTIRAGEENLMLIGMENSIAKMKQTLSVIHSAMDQLMQQPSFRQYHMDELTTMLHLLIVQKFPKFPSKVKAFCQKVTKHEHVLDESWKELAVKLNRTFVLRRSNEMQDIVDLQALLEKISTSSEWLMATPDPKNRIQIPYAVNSKLYCDGDIEVFGQGCYNTQMVAGSEVIINGFAKNGDIYAKDKIVIDEVGSEYGIRTSLRVSATGVIEIGYVHEGTRVQVGNRSYTFNQPTTDVNIQLNKKNQLIFQ
ncbi:DUF342 domain-containing protein [Aquibacillus sediminis]|uniref:DUF342 domain-containing protein n=1 Tax=Aquibacillus sediminis TaxID=2574734 RepID=UPI00110877D6|nr:FapA family protein [Aquibacillus sediminis]